MVVESSKTVKFSDLETGASGWVMYVGRPTPIIKTDWQSSGSRATNAQRLSGRNGRVSIPREALVYQSSGACLAGFEAKRLATLETLAGRERQADYDQTVQAAAGRWGY
jgi:hypothetical protein